MFYQQCLRLFSNTFPFDVSPAPSVVELALIGLGSWPDKQHLSESAKTALATVRPPPPVCARLCRMCLCLRVYLRVFDRLCRLYARVVEDEFAYVCVRVCASAGGGSVVTGQGPLVARVLLHRRV